MLAVILVVALATSAGAANLRTRHHKDRFEAEATAMLDQYSSLQADNVKAHVTPSQKPAMKQLHHDASNFECLHIDYDCVPTNDLRSRGTSVFLGEFGNAQHCSKRCAEQGDCLSFTYFTKGNLGRQCFGHLSTTFAPNHHPGKEASSKCSHP
jgi:hypothetical protein